MSRRGHACSPELFCEALKSCMPMRYSCNQRKCHNTENEEVTRVVVTASLEKNRLKMLLVDKRYILIKLI